MKNQLLIATAGVALLLCSGKTMKAADPDTGAASQYCVQSGGVVVERSPYYGTNGPTPWLRLAGLRKFCKFTSATDGSRIHILLETLYTTQPSLAALAYYEKPAENPPGPGNPASYYCTQLGGSDLFGGVTGAGGGWVGEDYPDTILEACIFPDMSSIDSWGLTYNTNGIIRGIDLTTVLRYKGPPPAASH